MNEISNFILYTTPNGHVQLDILLQDENLWLTQKGLAELFGVERSVITKHLRNIYDSDELDKVSTCAKFAQVQQEGNRTVRRELEYYNLDAIISVGYRVNSSKATQFRIWATKTLKEFIIKGFVLDDERLETERLILRVRTVADAEDIHAYASLPEVAYPAGFPPVKTLEDEVYYLEHILPECNQKENLPAGYGIVVKGTDKVIGSVDFNYRHADDVLELGYTLHPDYWGRGYVPEAARALIDLAFKELGLHKIELTCFGYNVQSQRVAEKLGFTLEARIRDRKYAQGNRCDSLIYGLLRSEWEVI
ncbi:GNAT family N-acetyltransferase [Streptococcus pseudopneumoniae]|uniref:GNAT family N-acetyltransferase n=1 Tax=Streptococcus pseudopneumoniae TaxID=257758 RepID=UPI000ABE3E8A